MIDTSDLNIINLRAALGVILGQLTASVGDALKTKWGEAVAKPSPVDAIVGGMEAAYAQIKAVPADAPVIAQTLGQVAYLIYDNGFHGKQDRALAIYKACRRALGEEVSGDDPEVDPDYAAPAEPEGE